MKRLTHFVLSLLIFGYTAFFSTQLLLHYYSFGSRALDLGNMGQAIWNTSQGRWFHQTNQPGATSRLSLHVEPILIPISWLYYFYSSPEILFLLQSFIVALGAWPVFALARFKLHSDGLALLFALVYLMFPAMEAATLLDFHAVTLAPTFLLAAFYFLETAQPKWFAMFSLLAVACKEDMTMLVLMFGLYELRFWFYDFNKNRRTGILPVVFGQARCLSYKNQKSKIGLTTIALSLAWIFLAVFVMPRTFAGTENIHWGRYQHLGDSPPNIVLNFFRQPQLLWQHLIKVEAFHYIRLLLSPTAFLALLNPLTLLLALPSLGINLLSNFPPMQRVNSLIYAAPIVPAVMISSIYGVANLKDFCRRTGILPVRCGQARCLSYDIFIGGLILSATLLYHAEYGYLPGGGQFRGWEQITDHHRRAAQLFAQIPPTAKLSAQDRLNPHVSQRETLYIFDRVDDTDHIVLDVTEDSWPLHPIALRDKVMDFLRGDFGIIEAFDGYLLLAKRPDLPKTLPDKFFDFARVPSAVKPQFVSPITFGNKLELLGYDLDLGAHEEQLPVVTLYWRATQPLDHDYTLWPFFLNRHGQIIETTAERPLVTTIWYPTSRWSPNEIILTRTLPRDLGDEFTLAVGVAKRNWTDPMQRLPITQNDTNLYLFEKRTWVRLNTFSKPNAKPYRFLKTYKVSTPSPQQPRQAQFWQVINLRGVDLPTAPLKSGEVLPFTLYWQSNAPLTIDLTTFVHLLDEHGNLAAQADWQPQDPLGYLPTTAWQTGRWVVNAQRLSLKNVPPGQYRLVVGWYYAVTGQRLPVTHNDSATKGAELVELGTVTVR